MTVNKDDLEISEAELEIVAYNQAMLPSSLKFKVSDVLLYELDVRTFNTEYEQQTDTMQ